MAVVYIMERLQSHAKLMIVFRNLSLIFICLKLSLLTERVNSTSISNYNMMLTDTLILSCKGITAEQQYWKKDGGVMNVGKYLMDDTLKENSSYLPTFLS